MAKDAKKAIDVAGLEDSKNLSNLKNQVSKSSNSLVEVIENAKMDISTLNDVDPKQFHNGNETSSKYDEEREAKILEGLSIVSEMEINGIKIDPLLILLSKFWEVKSIRSVIKDKIYQDAEAKGLDGADYLQNVLGEQIDKIAEIQTTIDRIKYARTYYKPREGRVAKGKTIMLSIDGVQYEIGEKQLEALRTQFKDAKELKQEVLKVAKKSEVIEL